MNKFKVEFNQPIFKGYIDDPLEEYLLKKTLGNQILEGIEESFYLETQSLSQDSKLGRNDPCLCGSGKKYKKCCIHLNHSPELSNSTFDIIKKFPTHKISSHLETIYGIKINREEFIDLAGKNTPREIYIFWELIAQGHRSVSILEIKDRLYLQNAIKYLIDRWCPNLAYYQNWEEALKIAYSSLDTNDDLQGTLNFHQAWEIINKKLIPSMQKFHDVDEILLLEEPFSNFVNDYEISFTNHLLMQKKYREMAFQFCNQILNQFLKEDPSELEHIQLTLARCYLFEGNQQEAENIYQKMILDYPKRAAGYAGWIESLTWLKTFLKMPQNLIKSKKILELARENGVEDGDSWDLEKNEY